MRRIVLILAVVVMTMTAKSLVAQGYGIVFGEHEVTSENAADIFGDGMASYNLEQNTLTLHDGFNYSLSHGLVTINTGSVFTILLEGKAIIYAAVDCSDDMMIQAVDFDTLKITSNISGSALKCASLTLNEGVCLDLLSRNSQQNMYALDCATELMLHKASLFAEVTTAQIAVITPRLTLDGCWLQKPRGGGVNASYGGICFADGVPAKVVRIIVEGFGIDELVQPSQGRVEKVFENGQIVIIKDGRRYNVAGQCLQ